MYVCLCVYVCMDGWMDGCMDGCMHACMYVWSRVPCSRERELGGPYHWGGPGIRSPDSYIYISMKHLNHLKSMQHYLQMFHVMVNVFKKKENNGVNCFLIVLRVTDAFWRGTTSWLSRISAM